MVHDFYVIWLCTEDISCAQITTLQSLYDEMLFETTLDELNPRYDKWLVFESRGHISSKYYVWCKLYTKPVIWISSK